MTVLDASALLAMLFREAGHERVAQALPTAFMSTVNVSEVLGRFARDGHDPRVVRHELERLPLRLVDFRSEHAARAAALVPATRPLGLSLGDRACLALAQQLAFVALTADRAWRDLAIGVVVEVIR